MSKPISALARRQSAIRAEVQQRFAAGKKRHLKMLARKMQNIRERKISPEEYKKLWEKIEQLQCGYMKNDVYVIETDLGKREFSVKELKERFNRIKKLRTVCEDDMRMAVSDMQSESKRKNAKEEFEKAKKLFKRTDKALYKVMQELIVQKKIEGKEQPKTEKKPKTRASVETLAQIRKRIIRELMEKPPAGFPKNFARLSRTSREKFVQNQRELLTKLVNDEIARQKSERKS